MRQSNDVHVVIPMLWFIIIIYAWHDKHISLITNSNAKNMGKLKRKLKILIAIPFFITKKGLFSIYEMWPYWA